MAQRTGMLDASNNDLGPPEARLDPPDVAPATERSAAAQRALAAVARVSVATAIALVLAGLAGWVLGSDALLTLGADFPALQISTGVTFLIASAATLALQRPDARAQRAARLGAAAVAAIAAAMLAGRALGVHTGLDLAFLVPAADRGPIPTLMPAASAVTFLLVAAGIAVASLRSPRTELVHRGIAAAIVAIGFLALVGLSFRLLLLYGVAPLFGMAVHAAIGFLLLGVALLAARPDAWLLDLVASDRPGAVTSRWLLPAAVVVPLAVHLAQLAAQRVGLVNEPLGQGMLVLVTVAAFGALILWVARELDRMDARRVRAERALRESYAELDARVVERTAALEQATAQLRERSRLLGAITASASDLIFAKDRAGRLLMVNAAYLRLIGKPEAEVLGRTSLELATDAQAGRAKAEHDHAVIESGESLTAEEVFPSTDGARIYLTTKSPLRDEAGRIVGLVGVATDITDRKRAERELQALVEEESRLREEAERANRAKDEFLAIVSHELRSPLNALRGWGHLLASTRPLEPSLVERATAAIKRNVEHQARLIDDILDTSRSISGRLAIEREPVDLVAIVQAAIEIVRPTLAAKRIELATALEAPAVPTEGDPGRLQQAVTNLVSNSVKFTPQGGTIDVAVRRAGDRALVVVRDTGAGIAPEFLPHVFERFTQADTSSTRRAGGLGIGLALVRDIVRLHGGEVRAESAGEGQGATFTIELPAPAVGPGVVRPPAAPERTRRPTRLAEIGIALVDDDADARDTIPATLRQAGASVEVFASGDELLARLAAALPGERPDVLLLDLAMPGEDGFGVLGRVRKLERERGAPAVPAIAVTAFTQIDPARLRAAGFADRIGKPVDFERLFSAIEALAAGGTARKVGALPRQERGR